jgi:hypothetical protein
MKILISLAALVPALAWAQGSFDGTWVTNVESVSITGKPDAYLLADGMFTCDACVPQVKIKADGSKQKVKGHAYYDMASVSVVDPKRVEFDTYAAGKLVDKGTFTVSANGKKMTREFVNYLGPTPATGKMSLLRVDPSPAGAHAISGSWRTDTQGNSFSADLLTVTFTETPKGLKMSSPTGQSYDAKFDGKQYLTAGDPGKTMVALKRVDARTIQETDTRQGKITDVYTFKVSNDGKAMHTVDEDMIHGTTMTYTAEKK